MATKRKFNDTDEREDCVFISPRWGERVYALDDVARIYWKCPMQSSIQQLLQGDPTTVSLVEQLGLVQTFSIPYCTPKIRAVKEFAQGFNPDGNYCDFRGRKLAFTTDVLRAAFLLPSGKFSPYKDHWRDDGELTKMFPDHPKPPYSVTWLEGDYEKWVTPISEFQELVLGKQYPNQVIGKHMWYFFAYLSNKVEPSGRPDWAELVHDDLKKEIVKLKKHLGRSRDELRKVPWKHQRFSCNCGTAVTQILIHFGFTEEELKHATSVMGNVVERVNIEQALVGTRMMDLGVKRISTQVETDQLGNFFERVTMEQALVGTRMMDFGVKRISTQVETDEPSAAQLEREQENANRKQRSVGGEPIAGSAGEVPTTSSTESRLDLGVDEDDQVADEDDQVALTGVDKSTAAGSMMDLGVKRISTQVETDEPSAAQLEREQENANRKQRCVGGEPIAGSAGEVPTTSSTESRLDLGVDEDDQVASTGVDKSASAGSVDMAIGNFVKLLVDREGEALNHVGKLRKENDNAREEKRSEGEASPTSSIRMLDLDFNQDVDDETDGDDVDGDSRCPQSSFQEQGSIDVWQTLEENLRKQQERQLNKLHAARIQVQAGATERDHKLAALRLEKDSVENKLSIVKGELATALTEKNKMSLLCKTKDNVLHEKKALLKQAKAVLEQAKASVKQTNKDKRTMLRIHEIEKSQLETALEEEKEKSVCQICLEAQKDTISLPCLHLHYCFTCLHEHNKKDNTCPTCRMPISGVLKANIWT